MASLRWLICSLLLASLVISNAYKNENVYNIIAPLRPVAYEHFKQIIEESFEIFTRLDYIRENTARAIANLTGLYKVEASTSHLISVESFDRHLDSHYIGSELHEYVDLSDVPQGSLQQFKELPAHYLGKSKLHPDTLQILNDIANDYSETDLIRWRNKLEYKEQEVLRNELKKCNRKAVVLPVLYCIRHAKYLLRIDHVRPDDVYVGKEYYPQSAIKIGLGGSLNDDIAFRMRAMETHGIWGRYKKFIALDFDSSKQSIPTFIAPTLKGNVQVIFVVHIIGILLSLIVFLVFDANLVGLSYKACALTAKKALGFMKEMRANL